MQIGYIVGTIFIAGAYWITYMNSPKYANVLLGVAIFSLIIAQIKPIQMFSLLGIVGVLVVMVMSRFEREKAISQWYEEHHFTLTKFTNAPVLFRYHSSNGTTIYTNFLTKIEDVPCLFSEQYHSYRSGNTSSVVVHCSYYFNGKIDINELERRFIQQKNDTPKSGFFRSQGNYFNLKNCDIFKPEMGGIVVSWRLQTTVNGYNERYEWIKDALKK